MEIVNYLNDHPTAAEILAAVYEVKPRFKIDVEEFEQNFNQLPEIFSQLPERPPNDFIESMRWAEGELAKMKKNKEN